MLADLSTGESDRSADQLALAFSTNAFEPRMENVKLARSGGEGKAGGPHGEAVAKRPQSLGSRRGGDGWPGTAGALASS